MDDMKFEDALKSLDNIVSELEAENVSLEEALKKYEQGIKLVKLCSGKLETAQKKVEILIKKADGGFDLKPLDKEEDNVAEKPVKGKRAKRKEKKDDKGFLF